MRRSDSLITGTMIVVMLRLVLLAFGASHLYADQVGPDVLAEALRRLKTQFALPFQVRPWVIQVTEATMTGDTPDHVRGSVGFRTLFGLPVGEIGYSAFQ